MKPRLVIGTAAATLAMLAPALGLAQTAPPEAPYQAYAYRGGLPAPAGAVELTVGSGYTQGFGTLQPGLAMPRVAKEGIGIDASAGYRIDRHYAFSVGAQWQELRAEREDAARGFAFTLAAQYHIAPSARLDPWLEVGSGYRMLSLVPFGAGPTAFWHGPQLVRLRAGLDVRLSREVALSPVIGVDATMFAFGDDVRTRAVSDPTVSTFVFAGLQGRLDIDTWAR